jgi:6-pyruvoyltetrahydropterin/6-carboxytetrahydropterin synthase
MTHRITVERNRLRFAAAHFATFGGECEPLHGHNYDVFVELEGDLTAESWVMDFGELKRLAREACEELDHKFLLQQKSRLLAIEDASDAWQVSFGSRTYRFPKSDVVALPIDNSTAERLAQWIWGRIRDGIAPGDRATLVRLRVGVEEMPGQAGWYEAPIQTLAPEATDGARHGAVQA